MLGHKLRDKLFCTLDLHVDDPIVVVDLTRAHLPTVDHDHEEDAVNDDQSAVSNVCLDVDRCSLDVPVVLDDQRDEHHKQERGKLSELERATVEGDH